MIEPGHDAWVVGDEAPVSFEFDRSTVETYAQSSCAGEPASRILARSRLPGRLSHPARDLWG